MAGPTTTTAALCCAIVVASAGHAMDSSSFVSPFARVTALKTSSRPIIRHRGTSLEMQFGFGSKENEEQKQKRFEMQQEILRKRREGDPLKSKYKPKEAAEGMPGKSEGGSVNYQIGTSFKSQPGGEDDGWVLVKGKWRYYPQNVKEGGGESGAAQGKKEEKKKTGPFGLW